MKKLLLVISLCLVITSNAQIVSVIDTSYHPKLDSTVSGVAACKIEPIKSALSSDTITSISIKVVDDNLQNQANLSFSYLTSKQIALRSITFTLQGQNYIDWNSNEYLFKLLATYIHNEYGVYLVFK